MKKAILIVLILLMSIFTAVAQTDSSDADIEKEVSMLSEDKCIDKLSNYLEEQGRDANAQKVKNLCQMLRQKYRMSLTTKEEGDRLKKELKERLEKNLDSLSEDEQKKAVQIGKDKLARCIEDKNVKECLQEFRIVRFTQKADLFRQRTVQGWEQARENFEKLKEKFSELKTDLDKEKDSFREAVKENNNEAATNHAKAYLEHVADVVINNLEKIKTKVEENDDLTDEEAKSIIEDIDAKIDEITKSKEELAAAKTKEEIKAAGKDIISSWNRMKEQVKKHTATLVRAATGDLYRRAEFLGRRLQNALDKLTEKNYDVSASEELMDEFNSALSSAKQNYDLAKQKFAEAKNSENMPELMQEAKGYLKAANEDMKSAHEISKQIIQEIKKTAKEDADEVLEETSEDYYFVEDNADSDEETSEMV